MKFIYVVPVLAISAALGASASPSRERAALQPPPAPATPPWLSASWQGEGAEGDPHAGLSATPPDTATGACTYEPEATAGCASCADGEDPHAGVHTGQDPHAGMYADDPHAGMYADDPHAGMYAADDPHAALHGGDPHTASAPHALGAGAPTPVERSRAPNGKTVAEVFATRSALDQTRVTVRGTVVKLTEGVLGKTYLHLRDGTGSAEAGDDDLTVTTTEAFALGETVEVEGQLAIDQDVGVGYSYPALLADATRAQR